MDGKLCECGCGQATRLARDTDAKAGIVAGQPMRWLRGHHMRVRFGENSNGWKGGRTITPGGYVQVRCNDHPRANHGYVFEHVLVAEKALGRFLPPKVVVHHVKKEDIQNNKGSNLVICENQTYHRLLHIRMDAYEACGDALARICIRCGRWDRDMRRKQNSFTHQVCPEQQEA